MSFSSPSPLIGSRQPPSSPFSPAIIATLKQRTPAPPSPLSSSQSISSLFLYSPPSFLHRWQHSGKLPGSSEAAARAALASLHREQKLRRDAPGSAALSPFLPSSRSSPLYRQQQAAPLLPPSPVILHFSPLLVSSSPSSSFPFFFLQGSSPTTVTAAPTTPASSHSDQQLWRNAGRTAA
ncbi:DNA-directed RNA polymerase II subunit 1-like [Solanum pennellii]|uniref:DNA-directed RNA polymerase II subunit 1-like n=1 Tax=Solanum pennellii TaxID=28526 RepID=A0ABM1H0B9_SOLPN|nr:DNA-directed RNA polymerase II subunit 1-like [Solanum pennellii]